MSDVPQVPQNKFAHRFGIQTDVPDFFVRLMRENGLEVHAGTIFYGLVTLFTLALIGLLYAMMNKRQRQPTPSSYDDFRRAVSSSVDDVNGT